MARLRATGYRGFYELLREEVDGYRGRFDDVVTLAPDLFRFLTNLLEDGRVPAEARRLVAAALAYFVAPYDVEPEEVYGPRGYLDDLFLCAYVAREVQRLVATEVVEAAWEAEFELGPALQRTLEVTAAELGARQDAVLRYVGLR